MICNDSEGRPSINLSIKRKHMADRHRLVSHLWIYTQLVTGFIHWNLNRGELKSTTWIEGLTAIIVIIIISKSWPSINQSIKRKHMSIIILFSF